MKRVTKGQRRYKAHTTNRHHGQALSRDYWANADSLQGTYNAVYESNTVDLANRHLLLVHSDGSCIRNGKPSARASIGVYFGPNSRYNVAEPVPQVLVQNSEVAELWAALQALRKGRNVLRKVGAEGIVLASDAECVCKTMTDQIYTWRANGFRDVRGEPIRHHQLFRQLSNVVEILERDKKQAMFCKVNRMFNKEADKLAKEVHKDVGRWLNGVYLTDYEQLVRYASLPK